MIDQKFIYKFNSNQNLNSGCVCVCVLYVTLEKLILKYIRNFKVPIIANILMKKKIYIYTNEEEE